MTGALAGLVACTAPATEQAEPPAEGSSPDADGPPLVSSLSVQVRDDDVQFRFQITNGTGAPLTLSFPTAQRVDFAVEDSTGAEVWRWSEGRVFAQTAGDERLDSASTRTWEGSWDGGRRRGSFTATARLTSSSHPLDLRTRFALEE
jgi:hypothetical protein